MIAICMLLSIYYKSAFLLIFFAQGLIFSLVLAFYSIRYLDRSAKWLSLLIFLMTLYVTPWMLGHDGWYSMDGYREFLFFMPLQQFFLIGPIIYFYVRSVTNPAKRLSRRDWLHFIPAAAYLIYSIYIFIYDVFVVDAFFFYADGRDKDLANWYQISGLFMWLGYAIWGYLEHLKFSSKIVEVASYADTIKFTWIRQFLIALLIVIVLRLSFFILYPEWGSFGEKWWYYLFISIIFYFIAFKGLIHVVQWNTVPVHPDLNLSVDLTTTTRISDEDLSKWKQRVLGYLNENIAYRNPNLTLGDIAEGIATTPRQISQVINQGFDMNFNDFINEMRVKAIIDLLKEGKHKKFTLLSLAMECGFNSKATFNRAFKKFTDRTPQQYIVEHNL